MDGTGSTWQPRAPEAGWRYRRTTVLHRGVGLGDPPPARPRAVPRGARAHQRTGRTGCAAPAPHDRRLPDARRHHEPVRCGAAGRARRSRAGRRRPSPGADRRSGDGRGRRAASRSDAAGSAGGRGTAVVAQRRARPGQRHRLRERDRGACGAGAALPRRCRASALAGSRTDHVRGHGGGPRTVRVAQDRAVQRTGATLRRDGPGAGERGAGGPAPEGHRQHCVCEPGRAGGHSHQGRTGAATSVRSLASAMQ
jgi:hypothetical protein